jgi:hypothetical protein
MSILQSVRPNDLFFARILLHCQRESGSLEKLHDWREHFLSRQTALSQIFLEPSANFRKRFAEIDQSMYVFSSRISRQRS